MRSCWIPTIPVTDAEFSKSGDPRYFWTERVVARGEEVTLTWHDIGDPLLIHTQPKAVPGRPYGVCTVLDPRPWRAPVAQRRPGRGQAMEAGAGRPAVQHLRAGVLGELDRRPVDALQFRR